MKLSIIVVLQFCWLGSFGQHDPQQILDKFFNLYGKESPNEAIDYLFSTNVWMDDAKDQIENVKFKLNGTLKLLGDYAGHELITTKSVGDRLTLYTFMVRYDRQPLRFSLLFYKPSDEWRLLNFRYDDSLSSELDEAANAYRLKENLEY